MSFWQASFLLGVSLAVAAVLGARVVLLVLAGAALAILQVLLKRLKGSSLTVISALYHFGLAWLVGYEALGGLEHDTNPALNLALAAAYILTYHGYLSLTRGQVESLGRALLALNGGQGVVLLLLILAYRPWQAWLVGLLLAAQALWLPKLRRDGDSVACLGGIQPFLMAVVMVSCLT